MQRYMRAVAVAAALGFGMGGCVLAPRATRDERARAEQAGAAWRRPPEARTLPALGPAPDWRALLRHALLANGAVEAAYHEWRAALARIDVAAAWPDTNVSLEYEYLFSDENLKSWDRSSLTLGFDPMQNLSFPTKPMAAGRVALADAQAAGDRFRSAKLAVQRDVLTSFWELALTGEQLRLERERRALREVANEMALARATAGAAQGTAVRSLLDVARTEDRVRALEAALAARRAQVNALVGRAADAPLGAPDPLPPPRAVATDDALVAAGVRNNPDLAAAARDHEARRKAVSAARQEFIPDVNPFVGIEGGMAQIVGAAVSLPTRITMIRGRIAEARSMEARAAAMAAQTGRDRSAEFLTTLAMLRDAERRTQLYETLIVPFSANLVAAVRASYEGGEADLASFLEAEELAIDARAMSAEARVERERRLAALEALGGFDVETAGAS